MQTHADICTHLPSQTYKITLQNSSLCVFGVHIVANDIITKPIAHAAHVVVHVHIVTKNKTEQQASDCLRTHLAALNRLRWPCSSDVSVSLKRNSVLLFCLSQHAACPCVYIQVLYVLFALTQDTIALIVDTQRRHDLHQQIVRTAPRVLHPNKSTAITHAVFTQEEGGGVVVDQQSFIQGGSFPESVMCGCDAVQNLRWSS